MSSAFKKFLVTEHSSESIDFLTAVKNLETVKEEKQKVKKCSEIMETFIFLGGKQELNISGELRGKALKNYEAQKDEGDKWVLEITPEQLFSECFKVVSGVLKHDSFKRFVRTAECEKIMTQFKHDSSVVSPAITYDYSYQNEYFTHPFIDDKDFDFFKHLHEDNYNWKLVGSKVKEQVNAFISNTNYLPEAKISNHVHVIKIETIVDCTFDQTLLSYFSNEMMMKQDPNCGRIQNLDYYEYDDLVKLYNKNKKGEEIRKYKRDLNVCALDFSMPFPFDPRFSKRADSCTYDADTQTFMLVGKNFSEDGEFCKPVYVDMVKKQGGKPKSMKAYKFFMFSSTIYQKIDERKILYKDISFVDFGGWGSSKIMVSAVVKDRKDKLKSTMAMWAHKVPENDKIQDYVQQLTRKEDGKVADGFGMLLGNMDFGTKV
eukprot:gene11272-4085_t